MKTVGLTGGIGSGKTTVANFFRELEVPVYIADSAGKKLMETSPDIKKQVTGLFGEKAYQNNTPNRQYIASQVFNNPQNLENLNKIIHPAVAEDFKEWRKAQKADYVLYEAAILFERGSYKNFDFNILVTAPYREKIQRLQKRDQSTVDEIQARMQNQWSDERKLKLADFVIKNESLRETREQVKKLHEIILKSGKN